MNEYQIITDACADLPPKLVNELGIDVIPMSFNFGDESYTHYPDEREFSAKAFFDRLRGGAMSTTNQINQAAFTDIFESYLQNGVDVLYIGFSSALSGTYHNSVLVAEELAVKYPDRTILVADSLTATLGTGLLVYAAVQKQREGMGIEELHQWVQTERLLVSGWFTVDDLNFLKRGGRVSSATAVIGTLLGVKPVLHVDDEGKLIPLSKVRGRKQSLIGLVNMMEERIGSYHNEIFFISHGDCLEDAKFVAAEVQKRFGIQKHLINFVGPTIGAHSGPGTVALFFLGEKR